MQSWVLTSDVSEGLAENTLILFSLSHSFLNLTLKALDSAKITRKRYVLPFSHS